jgi:hypothetical protein
VTQRTEPLQRNCDGSCQREEQTGGSFLLAKETPDATFLDYLCLCEEMGNVILFRDKFVEKFDAPAHTYVATDSTIPLVISYNQTRLYNPEKGTTRPDRWPVGGGGRAGTVQTDRRRLICRSAFPFSVQLLSEVPVLSSSSGRCSAHRGW